MPKFVSSPGLHGLLYNFRLILSLFIKPENFKIAIPLIIALLPYAVYFYQNPAELQTCRGGLDYLGFNPGYILFIRVWYYVFELCTAYCLFGSVLSTRRSGLWMATSVTVVALSLNILVLGYLENSSAVNRYLRFRMGIEQKEHFEHKFEISHDGRVLKFTGNIHPGSVEELNILTSTNKNIRVISLKSIGGYASDADKMVETLRKRGISTYTDGLCASACTDVFAGGKERIIGPNAKLGYHGQYLSDADKGSFVPKCIGFHDDQIKKLMGYGASREFADKAVSYPPGDVWVPPKETLYSNNIITKEAPTVEAALKLLSDPR
ncbi:COG3904 family protein [Pseudomonas aeruginosa]